MVSAKHRANPMELAWDEAARGYDAYFGPRFAPYLGVGVGALLALEADLPTAGAILVPCVGPGRELASVARAFPSRDILASDLSGAMVSLARERTTTLCNVSVARADATELGVPKDSAAGLLSVFGLQLLPNQPATLTGWLRLLRPGGRAVIVYWPRDPEPNGPFHSMRRLLRGAGIGGEDWEHDLPSSLAEAGATLLVDARFSFEISHEDAQTAWQALTCLGPLRGLAQARGEDFVAALGEAFVAELPPGPLTHTPEARLMVAQRR